MDLMRKVSACSGVCAVAPGITLGRLVVAQVLHEVCAGWQGALGGLWWQHDAGVNQEGKGLGQPRQVTTSGTHGPSRWLIFNM